MKKPENPCTPDCVKRDVGCKSYCPKWVAYTAEKAVYDTLVQKNRSAFNDIKAFQWVCCNRAIKRRKGT